MPAILSSLITLSESCHSSAAKRPDFLFFFSPLLLLSSCATTFVVRVCTSSFGIPVRRAKRRRKTFYSFSFLSDESDQIVMKGQQRFLSLADFLISIFDLVIYRSLCYLTCRICRFWTPSLSSLVLFPQGREGGIVLTQVAAVGRKSCATV